MNNALRTFTQFNCYCIQSTLLFFKWTSKLVFFQSVFALWMFLRFKCVFFVFFKVFLFDDHFTFCRFQLTSQNAYFLKTSFTAMNLIALLILIMLMYSNWWLCFKQVFFSWFWWWLKTISINCFSKNYLIILNFIEQNFIDFIFFVLFSCFLFFFTKFLYKRQYQ